MMHREVRLGFSLVHGTMEAWDERAMMHHEFRLGFTLVHDGFAIMALLGLS